MSTSCEKQHINREYSLHLSKNFRFPTDLLQQVYQQQVVLERIFIRGITAYGTIRVNNCSFHKRIFVKYTTDQWKTFSIVNAYYTMHYSDTNTDSFQFKLTVSRDKLLTLPMKISFVICYCANGDEFWDNNYSQNYTLEIIDQSSMLHDDKLCQKIAQDYHAIPNTFHQPGNICGLKNLGGTCYMNSVLQSLSFTSFLTNYFLLEKYSKGIIVNEYLNLLYLLCSGKYAVITPAPFKQVIGHIKYVYMENQQQDAHEFLLFLLDYLHRDLIQDISVDSIIIDLFYVNLIYIHFVLLLFLLRVPINLQ